MVYPSLGEMRQQNKMNALRSEGHQTDSMKCLCVKTKKKNTRSLYSVYKNLLEVKGTACLYCFGYFIFHVDLKGRNLSSPRPPTLISF